MTLSRRSVLKGLAGAGAVSAAVSRTAAAQSEDRERMGMLYDTTRCIGCKACVVACKKANNLTADTHVMGEGLYDAPDGLNEFTKTVIQLYKDEEQTSFVKRQCMHCVDPACVNACMIGALKKEGDTGLVWWRADRCVGCRYCQVACPFQVPKFEWSKKIPKIVKCELCLHMLKVGKEPGCCQACPKEAVIYGTYTDLMADAKERIARHPDRYWPQGDPKIFGEHDGGGTQVLYLSHVPFEKLGMPPLTEEGAGSLNRKVQHGIYKGFIAPVALYGVLGAVIWRNRRAAKKGGSDE